MTGFVGRVRRQPPPGKTWARCLKRACHESQAPFGIAHWIVDRASLLNCPTALRLYGPTELVQILAMTGFVGRVRRQPPPGKTWARCLKRACHESQAPFGIAHWIVDRASLLNCPMALRLYGPTELVQILAMTGFVGRVRRQPPPGKTWARCLKRACHESQAPFGIAHWIVDRASLLNCPMALRLYGSTELVQILAMTGFVGRVRRQPPPGKTWARCLKRACHESQAPFGIAHWIVDRASLLNCPMALRLYGPTELVQILAVTGFVGRVRRQPPPGKTWARCSKQACHKSQAPFTREPVLCQPAGIKPVCGAGTTARDGQTSPDSPPESAPAR
ncbi:Protein of uncharacterised function (DUF3521) [Raoultella planticola]|nr:Protein of uncharacterised function (DUF3521) [Raoultella planticola]